MHSDTFTQHKKANAEVKGEIASEKGKGELDPVFHSLSPPLANDSH